MNSIKQHGQPPRDDATTGETLVLGIGSTLRKDDGVGIVVIDRLREMELPEGVRLLDGGTAGIDLLGYLEGVTRLIIVDAMFSKNGNPGDIKVLSGDELRERDLFISGHYGRLSDILDMVGALWTMPETTIIGIVPKDCVSYEMELSPEVAGAVDNAVELIKNMLARPMIEVTILMPCLNESETLGSCIARAAALLRVSGLRGEILVSDNGSTDGSQDLARRLGARVVDCPVRGYGAALQQGIRNAAGTFILMGDSDDSYHFDEALPLIERLQAGFDVCMGSRLRGTIEPGAMPFLNRYLGNPVLTALGKIFFRIDASDFHCGMRAFRRDAVLGLNLVTEGMEWASEMVIKARLAGLRMTEVPITLHRDGRSRPPHLKRWRDGWRHLRYMLLHAPMWLFTIPGLLMILFGATGEALLSRGMVQVGHAWLDVHSLLVMAFLTVLGTQAVFTGLFARVYSSLHGILPYDEKFNAAIRRLTLEKLLVACILLGITGGALFLGTAWSWYRSGFAGLDIPATMRRLIPALTIIAVAVQGMFNGFMLSILFLKTSAVIAVPDERLSAPREE